MDYSIGLPIVIKSGKLRFTFPEKVSCISSGKMRTNFERYKPVKES